MTDEMPKGGKLVAALMRGDAASFKQGYTFANALYGAAQHEAIHAGEAASASLTIEGAILAAQSVHALLHDHWPSMTDENDDEIDQLRFGVDGNGEMNGNADLAIRTCACGEKIDGFDAYLAHLMVVFEP